MEGWRSRGGRRVQAVPPRAFARSSSGDTKSALPSMRLATAPGYRPSQQQRAHSGCSRRRATLTLTLSQRERESADRFGGGAVVGGAALVLTPGALDVGAQLALEAGLAEAPGVGADCGGVPGEVGAALNGIGERGGGLGREQHPRLAVSHGVEGAAAGV